VSAFEAFREQIETALATAQRERDHWARQAEKLSELLEGGEPSPREPKASPAGEPKPTPKAVDGPKPKPPRREASSTRAAPMSSEAMATVRDVLGDGPILTPDLIERSGMAKSTVYLALKTLREAGEIEHDGSRPRMWRLPGPTSTPVQHAADDWGRRTAERAPVRTPPAAQSLGLGEPEVGAEVMRRIEVALGQSGMVFTIHSLARAASCTTGAVVAALRRLRSDGRATELEPGKWRAASEPVADLVR